MSEKSLEEGVAHAESTPGQLTPVEEKSAPALPAAVAAPPAGGPPPPPNGGIKAWLQVAGAFFFVFNTWGLANAFGIFQTYYTTTLLSNSSPSNISWIGSVQGFLLLFIGVFCGRALDAGYFYTIVILGTFLEVFGMMMLSLAQPGQYYQVFLAQGLCVGLGSGCLFTPAISIVGTYFSTKRSLATGIAAAGSSLGGIIYPIMIRELLITVGFPWAVRAMAFVMLGTLVFGIATLKPRVAPRKAGPLIDFAAFKDVAYTTFCIGLMLAFLAFFIPFFYSDSYALNIGTDENLSFYVLVIMNAAGLIGRLLPTAIADYVGNLNMIVPCAITSGIAALAWISVRQSGNVIAAGFMYAFLSGGLMALPPPIIVGLTLPDFSKVGTRVGMALTIGSLGVLVGSPIAGAILKSQSPTDAAGNVIIGNNSANFSGVYGFTGAVLFAAALFMSITRISKKGFSYTKI